MLKNTFLHFPGVGLKKERSLWSAGVLTWDDFEARFLVQSDLFSNDSESAVLKALRESRAALQHGDLDYFAEKLPKSQHYRIALAAPTSTVFLDIETTGLSLYYDHTTLIGLGDSKGYYVYKEGDKIDAVAEILGSAKCVVTFNGSLFDLKFIRKEFNELRLPKAHVDLRFFGLRFGLRGTQKEIEQALGFQRPYQIRELKGESAPLLWYKYIRGDTAAGERLVRYNYSDIEGMKFIFDTLLGRILRSATAPADFAGIAQFFKNAQSRRWSGKRSKTPNRKFVPRPFSGKVGPHVKYADLITDDRSKALRVVGIDLTGSEARPTGWSLLVGSIAQTKTISTDADLIEETIQARADLVSIDSPLSLPRGRQRVTNDDPGRVQFGIMRECERVLKKRGVNVYPSLIDSMQKMTERGIRLAQILRSLGMPVIESYPGAAQDIMGIPRKRAGLEFSKQGLSEFGITGEFISENVTHDEVDAVTSAVVGLFFWAGKFEALGNDDEDYLIIPNLHVDPTVWRSRQVVAFSGPIAAGKTKGASSLGADGFVYGRYSQVLAKRLQERGIEPSREALQAFGEEVHHKPGQRWLSRQLVRMLPEGLDLAVDGIRFPEDFAFMVEHFGPALLHIHLHAPEDIRRARYVAEGNTAEAFEAAIRHPVEAFVPRLAAVAHRTIVNDKSEREFLARVKELVGKSASPDRRIGNYADSSTTDDGRKGIGVRVSGRLM